MCCTNALLSSTIQYGFDTVKHSIPVYTQNSLNERRSKIYDQIMSHHLHINTRTNGSKNIEKNRKCSNYGFGLTSARLSTDFINWNLYIYRKYNENIFSLSTESFRYEIIVELFLFSIKLTFYTEFPLKSLFYFRI